ASVSPLVVVAGLLAYHLHVLLDYVDGEVARCRGETSVRGAYFDLITDRVTFPLLVFSAGLGVYRQTGAPAHLIAAFVATFGLFLDKEAVDCWSRADNSSSERYRRYEHKYRISNRIHSTPPKGHSRRSRPRERHRARSRQRQPVHRQLHPQAVRAADGEADPRLHPRDVPEPRPRRRRHARRQRPLRAALLRHRRHLPL